MNFWKTYLALILFTCSWSFLGLAQAPTPTPSVVATAVVPANGVMEWVTAHGGFQSAVLLLVMSAFTLLSAVRQVLSNLDGVAPGAEIPAGMQGLTMLNKICVVLGQVVDFMQGNVKH